MGEPLIFLMTGTYAHAELAAKVLGIDDRRWTFVADAQSLFGTNPDDLKVIVTETAGQRINILVEVYKYLSERGVDYRYVDIEAKSRRDAGVISRGKEYKYTQW